MFFRNVQNVFGMFNMNKTFFGTTQHFGTCSKWTKHFSEHVKIFFGNVFKWTKHFSEMCSKMNKHCSNKTFFRNMFKLNKTFFRNISETCSNWTKYFSETCSKHILQKCSNTFFRSMFFSENVQTHFSETHFFRNVQNTFFLFGFSFNTKKGKRFGTLRCTPAGDEFTRAEGTH